MDFRYFAYECSDLSIYFTETLEQCREAAKEQRDEMGTPRSSFESQSGLEVDPMAIYEFHFRSPDRRNLLHILNSMNQPSSAIIDQCLVERTFIETVVN